MLRHHWWSETFELLFLFIYDIDVDDLILDDFPEVQRSGDKLFIVKENILVLLLLVWVCKDTVTPRVN